MNPSVNPSSIYVLRWTATQDGKQQTTCFSTKQGRFTPFMLAFEADGGKKQVAAGESIFHKFIILQALRNGAEGFRQREVIEPSRPSERG